MTKSSFSRRQKKLQERGRKKRVEYVYATTVGKVSQISVVYDPEKDCIEFDNEVENTFHEVSFERPNGSKIINRLPIEGGNLHFDHDRVLLNNFKNFVSIDTNTRLIEGHSISVVGIIVAKWIEVKGKRALSYSSPFCIELTDVAESFSPEKVGWVEGLRHLIQEGFTESNTPTGVIVDAHLNEIPQLNRREKSIYGPYFLPKNVQLIYASADVGMEFNVNKLIRLADKLSSDMIDHLINKKIPKNEYYVQGQPFRGIRILTYRFDSFYRETRSSDC